MTTAKVPQIGDRVLGIGHWCDRFPSASYAPIPKQYFWRGS
ncbi:hypothetical protein ACWATR_35830 [Nostoc sp. UIC 10890]